MGVLGSLKKFFSSKQPYSYHNSNELLYAAQGNKNAMKAYGGNTSNQAYANLLEMLKDNGRTDPRLMNRTLAGIQRNTQGAQMQLQGGMQARGFQNSGVGAALQAALAQGGMGKQADVVAEDAAGTDQRRKEMLALFQQLIGNPSIDWASMGIGAQNATRGYNNDVARMKLGVLSGIGKGLTGA